MNLNEWLKGMADSIREKKGTTDKIKAIDFSSEISNIDLINVEKFPEIPEQNKIYRAKETVLEGTHIWVVIAETPQDFGEWLGVTIKYIEVEEFPTENFDWWDQVSSLVPAYINKNTNEIFIYLAPDGSLKINGNTSIEEWGFTYQGVITDESQAIVENGWYIQYASPKEYTNITSYSTEDNVNFYEYQNNSYIKLNSTKGKVVVIDNDNLPFENLIEGTIYIRNNVPVLCVKTNEGRLIPALEFTRLALSATYTYELGIICDSLPENPIEINALSNSLGTVIYYLRQESGGYTAHSYANGKWTDYTPNGPENTYIILVNEVWYYRQGEMVKISKFGLSDSEISQIVKTNSGPTYTGNVFSIDRSKTQREYVVDGFSGTLTKNDFIFDDFDQSVRIRVGAIAGSTGVTNIEPFEVDGYTDEISAAAFYGCTSLTEINIDVRGYIREHAFYGCTNLKTVYIYVNSLDYTEYNYPNIGDYAFANCTSLTDIQFNGTMEQWNGGTFGKDWNKNTGEYTVHCTDGDLQKVVVSTEKVIEPLTVTENGVYASELVDGYKPVTVNVPIPSDTTATVEDIRKGETAYVNGEKVVGTLDTEKIETEAFQAGEKSEYDRFWDSYQQKGASISYKCLFSGGGWNDETFKPKYSFSPTSLAEAFQQSRITNLKQILLNQGVTISGSNYQNLYYTFENSTITHIGEIGHEHCNNIENMCNGCNDLISIDKLTIGSNAQGHLTMMTSAFAFCSSLEHVIIDGEITGHGCNVQWSPKLDKESLMSIINALKDYSEDTSGTIWYITFGSENLAKMTEDELRIAWNKGWEVR